MSDSFIGHSPNQLLLLAETTEQALEDIFLSGFAGVRQSSLGKLADLASSYHSYGMEEGTSLLINLLRCLNQKKGSFQSDDLSLASAFSHMEFYLEHLKHNLSQ